MYIELGTNWEEYTEVPYKLTQCEISKKISRTIRGRIRRG